MKTYEVYGSYGTATVHADRVRRDVGRKCTIIRFYVKDTVVAEFYNDQIVGWREVVEDKECS